MKKWHLVVIPGALVAPFLISFSSMTCGCLPDGHYLRSLTGVYPMDVSVDDARNAFLTRFPVGTPESEIKKRFAKVSGEGGLFDKHCRHASTYTGHECRFEEREVNSILSKYKEGFQINIRLTSERALEDAHFFKIRREL